MSLVRIVKYDPSGNIIWTKNTEVLNDPTKKQIIYLKYNKNGTNLLTQKYDLNKTSFDNIDPTLCIDQSGNSYISFQSDALEDPSGVHVGLYDIIIMKVDASGTIIWKKQDADLNTTINDIRPIVKSDKDNNIYICYLTEGTVTGGTSKGGFDVVIAKLSNIDGSLIWIKQNPSFNTNMDDLENTFDVDIYGNSYFAYQSLSNIPNKVNYGAYDIIICKLDKTGTIKWTKQESFYNTSTEDTTPSIAVDIRGNIIIAYVSDGAITDVSNNGLTDIVLMKLDRNGNLLYRCQHPEYNSISEDYNPSVDIDDCGNVYLSYERNRPSEVFPGYIKELIIAKFSPELKIFDEGSTQTQLCFNNSVSCIDINTCKLMNKKLLLIKIQDNYEFYSKQLETIGSLISLIQTIIKGINKLSSNTTNNNFIIKNQILTSANNYLTISRRKYKNRYLTTQNKFELYATVNNISKPVYYDLGLGGISPNELSGNLEIDILGFIHTFNLSTQESLIDLHEKISQKLCGNITPIIGSEFGIHIIEPSDLIITIDDITETITVYDDSDSEHYILMNKLKNKFSDYIKLIAYDTENKVIRIILKTGYLTVITESLTNNFIITTYLNNTIVNTGIVTDTNNIYLYGYLLFYDTRNNFVITYPADFLNTTATEVMATKINKKSDFIEENITLDISGIIHAKMTVIDKLVIQKDRLSHVDINIENFNSYDELLELLIIYIKPDCQLYHVWHTNNITSILTKYLELLEVSNNLVKIEQNNYSTFINSFFN
jgi:hypothetical protein